MSRRAVVLESKSPSIEDDWVDVELSPDTIAIMGQPKRKSKSTQKSKPKPKPKPKSTQKSKPKPKLSRRLAKMLQELDESDGFKHKSESSPEKNVPVEMTNEQLMVQQQQNRVNKYLNVEQDRLFSTLESMGIIRKKSGRGLRKGTKKRRRPGARKGTRKRGRKTGKKAGKKAGKRETRKN